MLALAPIRAMTFVTLSSRPHSGTMWKMGDGSWPAADGGVAGIVPSATQAQALAGELLGEVGSRWRHVLTAGVMAQRLGVLFEEEEASLLVAAATLHDIGYAPPIARTGFHPLDGGLHLRALGMSERLAGLVAHHSLAILMAPEQGVSDLESHFRREQSLLADALVYSDMHSAPDGRMIPAEERLADIAARRPGPDEALRAQGLRAAMARVGVALSRLAPVQRQPESAAGSANAVA